jgi:RNA polymerase sigma-B factor
MGCSVSEARVTLSGSPSDALHANSSSVVAARSSISTEEIFSVEMDVLLHRYLNLDIKEREKVRDEIFHRCQPYVRKIAYGLARRSSDPVDDLIQMGGIGLLKAMEKFNPLVGTRFKTYATYFITGEIRHYLRDKAAMIKAPRQMYELYYRMNQIIQQLSQELGRPPTDEEVADELQCSVSKINQAQDIERRRLPVSLDQFLVSDEQAGDVVYIEKLVDHHQLELSEARENRLLIEKALGTLKPELYDVVRMTYYEDLNQTEIAQKLGISQMQVSRRLRKALDLLFQTMREEDYYSRPMGKN